MEIPDLVRQAVGDEELRAGVALGDDDVVCFTPTRTLLYRGEGLLSDEGVAEFPHDFERLQVSEGRRKTKYTFHYVDGTEDLAVPNDRAPGVFENVLEGYLRVGGHVDANEAVEGAFRFSELTLIVTAKRLAKYIGEYAWEEDFESYPFKDVTGLDFEDGSVATSIVLEVAGRPQRIKAPNDQAAVVRKTLEDTLYEYHDVASTDELNRKLGTEDEAPDAGADDPSAGIGLESGIDPLVGGDEEDDDGTRSAGDLRATGETPSGDGGAATADAAESDAEPAAEPDAADADADDPDASADDAGAAGNSEPDDAAGASTADTDADSGESVDPAAVEDAAGAKIHETASDDPNESAGDVQEELLTGENFEDDEEDDFDPVEAREGVESAQTIVDPGPAEGLKEIDPEDPDPDDVKAISEQMAVLTEAVERQNQLLEEQRGTLRQLIKELRRGR